jgi:tetratricopeptide (TPR) repeat protein
MLRQGWVQFLRGRLAEAVELWAEARRLDPADAVIAVDLAAAAIILGNYHSAERWVGAAVALAPDHPYVRLARVHLSLARGRASDAVAEAERFLADQPGSFLALESLVQTRLRAGSYDLARPHLEAMRRQAPDDWNFWGLTYRTSYGWTLLKRGDVEHGVEVLHGVIDDARGRIEKGDQRPGLRREIAASYAALGERELALEWLKRAIDAGWRLERLHPSPLFEPIRSGEQYLQLMARIDDSVRRMSAQIHVSEMPDGRS